MIIFKVMKIVTDVFCLIGALTCMVSYILYLNLQPKIKEINFSSYDIKSKWKGGNTHR